MRMDGLHARTRRKRRTKKVLALSLVLVAVWGMIHYRVVPVMYYNILCFFDTEYNAMRTDAGHQECLESYHER